MSIQWSRFRYKCMILELSSIDQILCHVDFNNCIQITVVKWNDHIQFIVFPYTENKS